MRSYEVGRRLRTRWKCPNHLLLPSFYLRNKLAGVHRFLSQVVLALEPKNPSRFEAWLFCFFRKLWQSWESCDVSFTDNLQCVCHSCKCFIDTYLLISLTAAAIGRYGLFILWKRIFWHTSICPGLFGGTSLTEAASSIGPELSCQY